MFKVDFDFFEESFLPYMYNTVAIIKILEGLTFSKRNYNSVISLNYQLVRYFLEKATKLLHLRLASYITDVEKAFENVHIVGPLRLLELTNVSDKILEPIFQLKKTLRKMTFKNCKDLTNDGLKVLFFSKYWQAKLSIKISSIKLFFVNIKPKKNEKNKNIYIIELRQFY